MLAIETTRPDAPFPPPTMHAFTPFPLLAVSSGSSLALIVIGAGLMLAMAAFFFSKLLAAPVRGPTGPWIAKELTPEAKAAVAALGVDETIARSEMTSEGAPPGGLHASISPKTNEERKREAS
jgi:hypothetical protein